VLKAFKYRFYPTEQQQQFLARQFGCNRFVYNWALQQKTKAYQQTKKGLSRFALDKQLTQLKKELEWLNEVASQPLQQALGHLDKAFTRFFKEKNGFPKFKHKHGTQSASYPQGVKIDFEAGLITLPKVGIVKTVFSRTFEGTVKTTTISRTPTGKYFVSVLVEVENQDFSHPDTEARVARKVLFHEQEEQALGIDLGLKDFVTLSNGEKIAHPKHLEQHLKRLKVLQKRLAKKKKGSANAKKAKLKVALLHEKVSNTRKDFLHKLSSRLVKEFNTLCFEDFNIKGLMANHKLARHIGQSGWGMFKQFCEYKAQWNGKHTRTIGRFEPSSRLCTCGYWNRDLTLATRVWSCPECNTTHDRDVLAATNIKRFAFKKNDTFVHSSVDSRGEPVELPSLDGAVKQEVQNVSFGIPLL
jgi:putative transposase